MSQMKELKRRTFNLKSKPEKVEEDPSKVSCECQAFKTCKWSNDLVNKISSYAPGVEIKDLLHTDLRRNYDSTMTKCCNLDFTTTVPFKKTRFFACL